MEFNSRCKYRFCDQNIYIKSYLTSLMDIEYVYKASKKNLIENLSKSAPSCSSVCVIISLKREDLSSNLQSDWILIDAKY